MTIGIGRVKAFWEEHVNNEYYTGAERGSAAYFEEITRRRYRYHYHLPALFRRITAEGTAGKKALEVGCGIGIDTVELARLGFSQVVGVDLTEAAVELASRRASSLGLDCLEYRCANAEELPFGVEEFDVVYSFGVIHHTPRVERAVEEIHRVLKPGGVAWIMIYHSRSLVNALHRLFRLPYESPRNLRDHCPVVGRYTRVEAKALFAAFGSPEIVSDYPFTYGMRAVSRLVPVAVQRVVGRWFGWHLMIRATKPG
jgi:ubiquinone/menaquinone biosynthesis C-methylase UbiE